MSLKPKQIENLKVAYAVMAGIPAFKINLGAWRCEDGDIYNSCEVGDEKLLTSCGTSGCIAGWLSAHPHFIAQGLKHKPNQNRPAFGREDDPHNASFVLFGDGHVFAAGEGGIAGKQKALRRLRYVLYNNNAISSMRNTELMYEERNIKD